jgi:hypothetical protein
VTGPGGTEADRAARERLAREARETATALLDWVGTRVDGAATSRADGTSARPRQSPGPCAWCPVCALVAALRGEQPELTATLAEQASGLLVMLRLLLQAHAAGGPEHGAHGFAPGFPAHEHAGDEHPPHEHPPHEHPPTEDAAPQVPWDVAPHALFDPDLRTAAGSRPDEALRPAPERPTGKRGPRPSPRRQTAGADSAAEPDDAVASVPAAAAEPRPFPQPLPKQPPQPSPAPGARTAPPTVAPTTTTDRSGRGVQRIPVRRRTRPC